MARLIENELCAYMRSIRPVEHLGADVVDGPPGEAATVSSGALGIAAVPRPLGLAAAPRPLGLLPPVNEAVEPTSPYTYLDYSIYKNAFKEGILLHRIAEHFERSSDEVAELAADPDHGGQITLSSLIETMVGFELERDGVMGLYIYRGPKKTDLVDGWNRQWDVKAPPRVLSNFNANAAYQSVAKKFSEFPENDIGILLCVSFMTLEDYAALLELLSANLSVDRKYHVRQVNIEGILTKEDIRVLSSQESVR